MLRFEVKLEGQPTAAKIRAAPDALKRHLLGAFVHSATSISKLAASKVAAGGSGNLAGSFRIDVKDKGATYEVKVGPTAFYAGWVEWGHGIVKKGERNQARLRRRMTGESSKERVPPHHYFMPAVDALRSDVSAWINAAIARAEAETQGT